MLRFNDIVFGPIHSRRLGSSLGINLLPSHGKMCNFDCVYCECGWNKDGREDHVLPSYNVVESSINQRLSDIAGQNVHIDSITFSGNGEPTLHPDFPKVVDLVLELRDRFFPDAKVSVLSNATRLDVPDVFQALCRVDNPILKLDAPSDGLVAAINRPSGSCSVEKLVAGMKKFEGNFILQTIFLKAAGVDYQQDKSALTEWMDIVRQVRPRQVMAYSLDRPAPQAGLDSMNAETIKELLSPLIDEGFDIIINE